MSSLEICIVTRAVLLNSLERESASEKGNETSHEKSIIPLELGYFLVIHWIVLKITLCWCYFNFDYPAKTSFCPGSVRFWQKNIIGMAIDV